MDIQVDDDKVTMTKFAGDGGGWMVVALEDQMPSRFECYSIPVLGGEPVFESYTVTLLDALKTVSEYS